MILPAQGKSNHLGGNRANSPTGQSDSKGVEGENPGITRKSPRAQRGLCFLSWMLTPSQGQFVKCEGKDRFLSQHGLGPNTAGVNCRCEYFHTWK